MAPTATSTELSNATDQRPARIAARGLLRAEQFQPVAVGQDADRAEPDRHHQHHALEQRLCQRRDSGEQQQTADGAQRVGPEYRPHHPAAAAEQRGAADDHGGDRLQRIVGAHLRIARQASAAPGTARRRPPATPRAYRPPAASARRARPTGTPPPPTIRRHNSRARAPNCGTAPTPPARRRQAAAAMSESRPKVSLVSRSPRSSSMLPPGIGRSR